MTDIATTILELGKELDADERTVVAHKLLATLHEGGEHSHSDAEWTAELRRRVDDVETGRVELVSHEETVTLARDIATRNA